MDIINEGMTYSSDINLEEEIAKVLEYMRESGEFSCDAPRLVLIKDDVENARSIMSKTAFYDADKNEITLYTEGRHPSDLLKSWLHEICHSKQEQEGRLHGIYSDNITEDDNLAELEREAYEFSGMMFRKYKDSKKKKLLKTPPFPESKNELYEHLMHIVGEIQLNPKNIVPIDGDEIKGNFEVGGIKYAYKIHPLENFLDDGKTLYNIYFHPENHPIDEPMNNTTKDNYIKILNTMYSIILNFVSKHKPDYIGISSMNNELSKNYHAVYNNLARHNDIPGYKRKNVNMEFELENGRTGRMVIFQKKEEPLQEVCHIKSNKDPYGLNQFAREIMREIVDEPQKYQIYIDLDNTLVEFDHGFKNVFGMVPSTYEQKFGRPELVNKIKDLDDEFWSQLGFTQNGKALWNEIKKYNPVIITAPSGKASEIGKRKWINYNLGTHIPVVFASAENKSKYAGKDKILIDDLSSTIYDWIDKGGIGIHYISAFNTVSKLKKLGL